MTTVSYVLRVLRPRLAEVLAKELRHAHSDGVGGAVRLLLFAKSVLRPPPRTGRRKRYVVAG